MQVSGFLQCKLFCITSGFFEGGFGLEPARPLCTLSVRFLFRRSSFCATTATVDDAFNEGARSFVSFFHKSSQSSLDFSGSNPDCYFRPCMPVWLDFNDCWRSFLCKLFYISTQLFKVRKRSFGVRTRVWDFFGRDFTGLHRPSRCLHSFSECLHHAYTGFWNAYTLPTLLLHHAYTMPTPPTPSYMAPTRRLHSAYTAAFTCLHYAFTMPTRCLPYAYPMPTLFQFLIKRGEGRPPPHLPPPKPRQGRTAHKRLPG